MRNLTLRRLAPQYPILSLTIFFVIWKALLAAIALTCPVTGYDTSADLLRVGEETRSPKPQNFQLSLDKFVRWDAIYFVQISNRGIVFEQEWAFGWGFTKLLSYTAKVFAHFQELEPLDAESLAGIVLAHGFHLLSAIMLFQLSSNVFNFEPTPNGSPFALLVAGLHVISPAGIFLSAPYSESSFSFFNFAGLYLYSKSLNEDSKDKLAKRDFFTLSSGLVFGLATTLRSNGLLTGSIFCFEVIHELLNFRDIANVSSKLRRLGTVVLAGNIMACCAMLPQIIAYFEYCVALNDGQMKRPWCFSRFPSIYAWVQSHYWQVGFLRYWTVPNIPLFVLASPMLYIMSLSVLESWNWNDRDILRNAGEKLDEHVRDFKTQVKYDRRMIQSLAIPQAILTVLALTNYHVQIISRLSSGYPVWYWWLASKVIDNSSRDGCKQRWNVGKVIVKWMVFYALIQGGLFASFLPPA